MTWTEPLIRNFDPLVDVLDQNYESGDMFPVGTWVILYQLRDVNSQLEETCSFVVRVEGMFVLYLNIDIMVSTSLMDNTWRSWTLQHTVSRTAHSTYGRHMVWKSHGIIDSTRHSRAAHGTHGRHMVLLTAHGTHGWHMVS